jgi:hypothetical protein
MRRSLVKGSLPTGMSITRNRIDLGRLEGRILMA